jgi:hypothetical protein
MRPSVLARRSSERDGNDAVTHGCFSKVARAASRIGKLVFQGCEGRSTNLGSRLSSIFHPNPRRTSMSMSTSTSTSVSEVEMEDSKSNTEVTAPAGPTSHKSLDSANRGGAAWAWGAAESGACSFTWASRSSRCRCRAAQRRSSTHGHSWSDSPPYRQTWVIVS